MPISISLLLPTWMRHDALRQALESVRQTISKPAELEVIAHCVYDDLISLEILQDGVDHVVLSDRVGYKTLPQSINAMATLAHGDWLFPFADDVVCESLQWDEVIRAYDHTRPTLLTCEHDRSNEVWFPIISRPAYEALGCVTQSQFYDLWLTEAFMRALPLDIHRRIPARFTNRLVCHDTVGQLSDEEAQAFELSVADAAWKLSEWRAG